MSETQHKGSRPEPPRLYHCEPGQSIRLTGNGQPYRTLITKIGNYAYFDRLTVSVCHPVHEDDMKYGVGGGWRHKSVMSAQELATA